MYFPGSEGIPERRPVGETARPTGSAPLVTRSVYGGDGPRTVELPRVLLVELRRGERLRPDDGSRRTEGLRRCGGDRQPVPAGACGRATRRERRDGEPPDAPRRGPPAQDPAPVRTSPDGTWPLVTRRVVGLARPTAGSRSAYVTPTTPLGSVAGRIVRCGDVRRPRPARPARGRGRAQAPPTEAAGSATTNPSPSVKCRAARPGGQARRAAYAVFSSASGSRWPAIQWSCQAEALRTFQRCMPQLAPPRWAAQSSSITS